MWTWEDKLIIKHNAYNRDNFDTVIIDDYSVTNNETSCAATWEICSLVEYQEDQMLGMLN